MTTAQCLVPMTVHKTATYLDEQLEDTLDVAMAMSLDERRVEMKGNLMEDLKAYAKVYSMVGRMVCSMVVRTVHVWDDRRVVD